MTKHQAARLVRASGRCGITAEMHAPLQRRLALHIPDAWIVRIRNPAGGWLWCRSYHEWPGFVRYIRQRELAQEQP